MFLSGEACQVVVKGPRSCRKEIFYPYNRISMLKHNSAHDLEIELLRAA